MKTLLRGITLAAFLTISTTAQAGLMLEPYLGYQTTAVDAKFKTLDLDAGGANQGVGFGLRAGYSLIMAWFALDYMMVPNGKFKPANELVMSEADYSRSDLWLTAGIDLPVLLRFWGGYGLMNTATFKDSSGDSKLTGGSHMKFGLGFTGLPLVSLNLEYLMHEHKKIDAGGTETSTSDIYKTFKESGMLLSVSVPFDL